MMTRAEHLEWSKQRALEYVERGNLFDAMASMGSDLNKHDGTRNHAGIQMGLQLLLNGHMNTPAQMREFINGFN